MILELAKMVKSFMVKWNEGQVLPLNATGSKLLPAPPRLMASLMAGFDAIATHISLILFPLGLDLFLWLGPRLKITRLLEGVIVWMSGFPRMDAPEATEMLRVNQENLRMLGDRFNLMVSLRTYPVGIPSLMSSRMPVETLGNLSPMRIEIPSFWGMLFWWMLLTVIGYGIGSLYFHSVANALIAEPIRWGVILRSWPRVYIQSILLAVCLAILVIVITIPASCMIVSFSLTVPSISRIVVLMYAGLLIWLLFPLFLSPHGIFINQNNVLVSLKQSILITRSTLPTTGILFLIVIVISQGLDVLWSVPEENSWFTLIGLAGHAFVTTGLLAASFVYYRDADRWIQSLRKQ